jgi:hypothetical protein
VALIKVFEGWIDTQIANALKGIFGAVEDKNIIELNISKHSLDKLSIEVIAYYLKSANTLKKLALNDDSIGSVIQFIQKIGKTERYM